MGSSGSGWVVVVAVLVATTAAGVLWRRNQGRLRALAPATKGTTGPATLLLFTTPSCTSCQHVRSICATIDAHFQEVDAAAEPARARRFDVWRSPTLFVLDAAGTPVWRTTGVPKRADLLAAVGEVNA